MLGKLKLSSVLFLFLGLMAVSQVSQAVNPEIIPQFNVHVVEDGSTDVLKVNVVNPDGNPLAFSITGGTDQAKFSIDPVGNLSFVNVPDFENPTDSDQNNTYRVVITVQDTVVLAQTDSQSFTIVVLNDPTDDPIPPTITQEEAISIEENTAEVVDSIAVDNPDGFTLSYSIEDTDDGALFAIDSTTGKLDFIVAPDYEEPQDQNQDNVYILTITVTDSRGERGSKAFTVTVVDLAGFEQPTAVINIEEPSTAFPRSGIATLRGWAVSQAEIDRLELFVDGEYYGNVPMGGKRLDVAEVYHGFFQPEKSGFSMAFPYFLLDTNLQHGGVGYHNILIRAFDVDGYVTETSTNFETRRFTSDFMADRALMNLDDAIFISVDINYEDDFYPPGFFAAGEEAPEDGNGFLIQGMTMDGVDYDVVLEWQVATQQFEIVFMRPATLRSTPFNGVAAAVSSIKEKQTQAVQAPILVTIEEPSAGVTSSGISNLRGWVVSVAPIEKIELFVDGQYSTDIPYGGTRKDVAAVYPEYPNSEFSGFSLAYPYSELQQDKHTFIVRATDINGLVSEQVVRTETVRFQDSFVDEKTDVKLSSAAGDIRKSDNEIILDNVSVTNDPFSENTTDTTGGETIQYRIILQWEPATQQFEINDIYKMPEDDDDGFKLGTS